MSLVVKDAKCDSTSTFTFAVIGYPDLWMIDSIDLNGASQEGCRRTQVFMKHGVRYGVGKAYIHPVLERRRNLCTAMGQHPMHAHPLRGQARRGGVGDRATGPAAHPTAARK